MWPFLSSLLQVVVPNLCCCSKQGYTSDSALLCFRALYRYDHLVVVDCVVVVTLWRPLLFVLYNYSVDHMSRVLAVHVSVLVVIFSFRLRGQWKLVTSVQYTSFSVFIARDMSAPRDRRKRDKDMGGKNDGRGEKPQSRYTSCYIIHWSLLTQFQVKAKA